MKTLAIVGASYLQLPLVRRARELGIRTVCFAWTDGAVCRDVADVFYPISIVDRESILEKCREERIDGITSIASDTAVPTIAYVAQKMGLVGNSVECAVKSTNKFLMRQALSAGGGSCPKFCVVSEGDEPTACVVGMRFPLIVKPADRSGSMGVKKVKDDDELRQAVRRAIADSFCKKAVVEECVTDMREISVEGISYDGEYHLLQVTDKVTTGAPYYVELGHHQPARLSPSLWDIIETQVRKGIAALDIRYGASHAELMITPSECVYTTEIGARMGGDFIGSDLVRISTGYDFLKGVIDCALGTFAGEPIGNHAKFAGVWFYAPESRWVREAICHAADDPRIVSSELQTEEVVELTRSADRSGYFIYQSDDGRYEVPEERTC